MKYSKQDMLLAVAKVADLPVSAVQRIVDGSGPPIVGLTPLAGHRSELAWSLKHTSRSDRLGVG